MNARIVAVAALVFAAAVFLYIGLTSVPRSTTHLILGVVFAILAMARLRRATTP